jgi:hypothetical protein
VDCTVAGEERERRLGGTDQSVTGIVQAVPGGGEQDADGQAGSSLSTGKMDLHSPGWTKKVRNLSYGMS